MTVMTTSPSSRTRVRISPPSILMDFNPEHQKWQCCCFHIIPGLKILSIGVLVVSTLFLVLFGHGLLYSAKKQDDFVFAATLLSLCLATVLSSALLVLGLFKKKAKLMYPSVVVGVGIVIFVAVFGVSHVVLQPDEGEVTHHTKQGKNNKHSEAPSMTARLVFLIFVMMIVCCVVFYAIFLIMKAIQYVKNVNKLRDRRQSLINASQIDPELFDQAYRRPSHQSFTSY
ncbi:unnamed protein product [Bursaphelenchus xylophilus]|uniref:(pine wood nematode) hypothetical protein n=1 Tax=Bursaphelenchus xylophilus TaxID=6326 RepID=A0A7I8XAZ2_BURXY|nr:unnamed protein product [Bursaphelenchus xylophilus]CAG9083490.1 unnamed protein product [Bursaphelenchus xylophilus]